LGFSWDKKERKKDAEVHIPGVLALERKEKIAVKSFIAWRSK
jgi:hypothetical protein